jgi:hypothetical protein
MEELIHYKIIKDKIQLIRTVQVLIDSDVAEIYGVKTMHVNQAVSRNLDKFPNGYIIELTGKEKSELITNCDRFKNLKHSTSTPKAFTEKGLYMLATILKSLKRLKLQLQLLIPLVNYVNYSIHYHNYNQQI